MVQISKYTHGSVFAFTSVDIADGNIARGNTNSTVLACKALKNLANFNSTDGKPPYHMGVYVFIYAQCLEMPWELCLADRRCLNTVPGLTTYTRFLRMEKKQSLDILSKVGHV